MSTLAWQVELAVRQLGVVPGSRGLEGLARFLLRSEAIASSRIEGLQVSPQQVGLAELVDDEHLTVQRLNHTAKLVANNIRALREATSQLVIVDTLTVRQLEQLQALLLSDQPQLHGVRTVQNWIGGSNYSPIEAHFVPPAPAEVPELMQDLVAYMNGAAHAPLIQAGLVHAQFETIHPFPDGNGRVGRALIHTVLVRRGLTPRAVLPISPVLLTRSEEYVEGLTAFRATGAAATAGLNDWLTVFLQATGIAVEQARAFAVSLDDLRGEWEGSVAQRRTANGKRAAPRSDSGTARILDSLQEHPVLTAASAVRLLDISRPAAGAALEELTDAGILSKRRLDGKTSCFIAGDVFELITFAERRLASTKWDTGSAKPGRPVPFPPG